MSDAQEISSRPYDAVVVGARCAGAATAMLLARKGARVLAIDRGTEGSDTLSTHALMRGGALQLHRWGLLDAVAAAGTPPIRSATFHYGDEPLAIPIRPKAGVPALFAPRRTLLDALLVNAAREAGATVLHRAHVVRLRQQENGRVAGVELLDPAGRLHTVDCGIVIGADGLNSSVARLAGSRVYRQGTHASAVVYAYWRGMEGIEGYHWHYRPGVSAGVIPTNDGHTCVFVAVPSRLFSTSMGHDIQKGYEHAAARVSPALGRAIAGGSRSGAFKGFQGHAGIFRQSWGPGWALVGDAGYFKDPITAHGITDALRDAELLARAIVRGGDGALAEYQAQRDALSDVVFEATDALASFGWDLPRAQALHQKLADGMNDEVKAIAAFDAPDGAVAHALPVPD